jgi:prevent-host-death family protein
MAKYTIYDAKNNFSKLLQKAAAGEEVVIMNRDEPVAQIVPIRNKKKKWGSLRDKIKLHPGWDAPIEDFKDYS